MCVGFGSDEVSIMIGKQKRIVVWLKEKLNIFLTFVYCMTHMINLMAIDVTKVGPCKCLKKWMRS
jgi:hypothetical protein